MCIDKFFNATECVFVSVDDYVDVPECKECVNVYVQSALCDTWTSVYVTVCIASRVLSE